MNYLLDTCVLSELAKEIPNPSVVEWIGLRSEETLFVSVLTIGEIVKGIERLSDSKRRTRLKDWLERDLRIRFEGRIFHIDTEVASEWGRLVSVNAQIGKIISPIDGLISATAKVHFCKLVTRNVSHMALDLKEIVNPWVESDS